MKNGYAEKTDLFTFPDYIKCQEVIVQNMSLLICRIPHCSVKILFKSGARKKVAKQCCRMVL